MHGGCNRVAAAFAVGHANAVHAGEEVGSQRRGLPELVVPQVLVAAVAALCLGHGAPVAAAEAAHAVCKADCCQQPCRFCNKAADGIAATLGIAQAYEVTAAAEVDGRWCALCCRVVPEIGVGKCSACARGLDATVGSAKAAYTVNCGDADAQPCRFVHAEYRRVGTLVLVVRPDFPVSFGKTGGGCCCLFGRIVPEIAVQAISAGCNHRDAAV